MNEQRKQDDRAENRNYRERDSGRRDNAKNSLMSRDRQTNDSDKYPRGGKYNDEYKKRSYETRDTDRKRRSDFPDESGSKKPKEEKEMPNFSQSGALAKDLNTVNGVLLKYSEPPEARLPDTKYRLYAFKNEKADIISIHRQSAYLVGRERKVCDIPLDHPSISSQHAVLQYRQIKVKDEYGVEGRKTNLYIIDLESSNGTVVNKKKIPPSRYYQLLVGDVVKFENILHALAGFLALTYPLLTVSTRSQVSTNRARPKQIETLKKIIQEEGEDLDAFTRMTPSAVAATITTILTNPIWVVNTRLLVKKEKNVGVKEAVQEIYYEEGLGGFWKGILPALVLVINPVIQFAVFERIKRWWTKTSRYLTTFHYFTLGAFSKLCATLVTYPYILLRSRLHIKHEKTSMMDEFKQIIDNEDKIETEIPLGKWDDSVLIDTWNLALEEYNKYYSIDPEVRPQKKQKKKREFVEMEPKISDIQRDQPRIKEIVSVKENVKVELAAEDVSQEGEIAEEGEYQDDSEIQAQPNRLVSNLFPTVDIQCDSCNESDPQTSKLIDRIMPIYYKGYQEGYERKEQSVIENKLERAWYIAGYETGSHISTN
ncbi:hypothetical protein HDV06_004382 [Boothiomyces sp. JEL0866]|nr:hypothetical protein HDV06_004382 [Boothiomyces sp. JEL0866]